MDEMTVNQLHRRAFIVKALSVGVAGGALGWPHDPFAQTATAARTARRVIDAHCHIFNGKDIPTRGFLNIVVLENYPSQVAPAPGRPAGMLVSGLARLIAELVYVRAPTADAEQRCLDAAAGCGLQPDGVLNAPISVGGTELDEEMFADYARLLRGEPRRKYFKSKVWVDDHGDLDEIMDAMRAPALSRGTEELQKPIDETTANKQMAEHFNSSSFRFSDIKAWGDILCDYRWRNVERYLDTYDRSEHRLVMFAPATVDFSNWLNDQSPTPMRSQVRLMDSLSRHQKHTRMHGYVGFDPLRQLVAADKGQSQTPLDLLKDSVRIHGFLGVKLYSPMGFRPTGNSEKGLTFPGFAPGLKAGFGAKLDRVLQDLYDYCRQDDVPILAHTANSQAANENYGLRAHPRYWREVLRRGSNAGLKLNLAHFGHFGPDGASGAINQADLTSSWEWEIGRMIKEDGFPNVYADLSYLGWLAGPDKEDGERRRLAQAALRQWLTEFDPECRHLLFGTDWSMTVTVGGHVGYMAGMETFLKEVGLTPSQLDNVFFANAVRFFGLRQGDKGRIRLSEYYRRNRLDSGPLEEFNDAT